MTDTTNYVSCMMREFGYTVETAGPFFRAFARRAGKLFFPDRAARMCADARWA